ncbi:ATP-binding protein [Streptomyces xiamenensis]|uniref:ATP-binding protein n=1 Tax=Streptomyces xiamenensis TaxID=408015 RepID=UPI003433F499
MSATREPGADHPESGTGPAPGTGNTYRIGITGDAAGPVIAGHHNLIVDAQHGSTVTVQMPRQRPAPVRRENVRLLPRQKREPVGRTAELAELVRAVGEGGPVQLWGAPGSGKSTLLRYAARLIAPGPDGVLFLGRTHHEPRDLAQEIFEAFYDAPGHAPTPTELRLLMTGVRGTVYLDNVMLRADGLAQLMDAAPDLTFVLAGRERILWDEGTAVEVKGLSRDAAADLLARTIGRPLRAGERDRADGLWQATGGLPLPLLRAAALAGTDPDGVRVPRPAEITALLPALLDRLDGTGLSTLRVLATLDNCEIPAAHLGGLADAADPAGTAERLVDLGLVQEGADGYRLASGVLDAVRSRFPGPFPAGRLCDYFAAWVAHPSTTARQIAEHGALLEHLVALAERAGRPDLAIGLARATSAALATSLRFGAWGRLLGRGWAVARHSGDQRAEAYFLREEAVRTLLLGKRVVSAALVAEAAWLLRDLPGSDAAQPLTPDPPPAPAPGAETPEGLAPQQQTMQDPPSGGPNGPEVPGERVPDFDVAAHMAEAAGGLPADGTGGVFPGTGASWGSPPGDPWPTAAPDGPGSQAPASPAAPETSAAGWGGTPSAGAAGPFSAQGAGVATVGTGVSGMALLGVFVGLALVVAGAVAIGTGVFGSDGPATESSGGGGAAAESSGGGGPAAGSSGGGGAAAEPPGGGGLVGTWLDPIGQEVEIVSNGSGSYTWVNPQMLCGPTEIALTGDDHELSGPMALFDPRDCAPLGDGTLTVTTDSTGDTAVYEYVPGPGMDPCEIGCVIPYTRPES